MEDHHRMVLRTAIRPVMIASAMAVLLLPAACGMEGGDINDDPNAGTVQEQFDTLLQRPSFEEMTERYQEMVTKVRRATVQLGGIPEWRDSKGSTPISGAGCGFDFPDIGSDGGTRQINGGVSEGAIPDDRWPEVIERVGKIAESYGFNRREVFKDEPGDHDVRFYDSYGGDFVFGTKINTSMVISSGCFLKNEARERGFPSEAE
ncbi:hypothetical protein SacmaDRAFT_5662 [Saccharomonospora marina XMU15]|uniref:Lipoprotein n=2 Tax=Saccharomonospora TaxID=1851 RepID=H5XB47_9PSEU|nr:hypothetical protein SacmaDRAFT_5662 [Saccharomonospora marina XMU15]